MKFLTLFVAIIVTLSACLGGDSYDTILLSDGSWELTFSKTTNSNGTIDNYANLKACERDNRFNFKLNGNLEIDEGQTKCKPNDPQTFIQGTWSLPDDETNLIIDEIEYFIIKLNDDELLLSSEILENGEFVTIEIHFRR